MFTTCPNCTLTLVITAPDLRAGQGYVRCGRCANVFNALINLSDGGVPHNTEVDPTPAVESAPAGEPAPAPIEDIAMPDIGELPSFEPDIVEPVITDGELEFHPEKTSVADIFVEPQHEVSDISSGTFESIVLEGDPFDALASSDSVEIRQLQMPAAEPPPEPEPEAAAEPPLDFDLEPPAPVPDESSTPEAVTPPVDDLSAVQLLGDTEPVAEPSSTATVGAPARDSASSPARVKVSQPEAVFPDAEAIAERFIERKQNERLRQIMLAGSIVLAVLLVAQLVHQSRRTLAASDVWGKPVRALYGAFGVALEPDWNIAAYDVRQLGAEAEPGDATRLIVRASIRNAATRAQPLPLLRLTLQDRYGKPIATRDLQPAEYLPENLRAMTELAADQRLDTEVRVVDATRAAIGFELDACLPSAGGVLVCANDARRRLQAATR